MVRQIPRLRPRAAKRGRTDAGYGVRSRHTERGAETSDGGWRVEGTGKLYVENVPLRERRWGTGVTAKERLYNGKCYWWWGGIREEEIKRSRKPLRQVDQAGL